MKPKHEKLIGVKIPRELLASIDAAVREEDTDRSKFVRNAVRDRLRRTLGDRFATSPANHRPATAAA